MNPDNPVVRLCAEGMNAEGEGRPDEARRLFQQAWDESTDDFEACVAAHYLARHQETPEETLRWNQESLVRADAVADDRVRSFYPSLYLNLGKAHEELGQLAEARRYYTLASRRVGALGEDGYGEFLRRGIAAGQDRVGSDSNG